MTRYKVGYIVGSLATASINRRLSKALIRLAPPDLEFVEIPIKDLPLYSYDYDADYPAEGRALKDAIAAVDAVLFVTPEYNRSIPGGLKNAIDWASRPWGDNSFARKPSAVIGASPGVIGTAVAQQSLRSVLTWLPADTARTSSTTPTAACRDEQDLPERRRPPFASPSARIRLQPGNGLGKMCHLHRSVPSSSVGTRSIWSVPRIVRCVRSPVGWASVMRLWAAG